MRRLFVLVGMGLWLLPAFSACGLEQSGGLDSADGSTKDGPGNSLGTGTCFPGAKVCPNAKGELVCLGTNDAENGCQQSTSCEPCALPHATANCSSEGKCAVESCESQYADCNGDSVDGCEVDLSKDSTHCGDCATNCKTTNGPGWICEVGVCEVNECCPTGDPSCDPLRDCDKDKQNGCEVDTSTDSNNCAECGQVCTLAHAQSGCSQSTCVIILCDNGWADCDSNAANGCETNVATDSGNCGQCGKVCNSTNGVKACSDGNCEISCFTGFGDCDANPGENGCETNILTSALNCSTCGNVCNPPNATGPTCTNGNCGFTTCASGFTDCDGNAGNGCEVHTAQDKNNCGTCGNVCPVPTGGSVVCSGGSCSQSCGSLTQCGGVCVDTSSDLANCGQCGKTCNPPANSSATCSGGACGFNCNSGYNKCGSSTQCYNIQNDPLHCGGSCTDCSEPTAGTGASTCTNGSCGITCSGPTPNKCGSECVDWQTNPQHCGSDCLPCNANASGCSGGVCTCSSGLTYCNDTLGCRACCPSSPLTQGTCAQYSTCCADGVCRDCCVPGQSGSAAFSCQSGRICCSDNTCQTSC